MLSSLDPGPGSATKKFAQMNLLSILDFFMRYGGIQTGVFQKVFIFLR
jgi:hypothetical protein